MTWLLKSLPRWLLLAALLCTGPAGAAAILAGGVYPASQGPIGTPVSLGVAQQTSGTTLTLTTTAVSNAQSLIYVSTANQCTGTTPTGVTDSAGNTYTPTNEVIGSPSSADLRSFYSKNSRQLPLGGTITITFSSSGCPEFINAASLPNASLTAPSDVQGAGLSNAGTTPSIATGALGATPEVIFGESFMNNSNASTFTEASGFTGLGSNVGAQNGTLHTAFKAAAATTTVTYATTFSSSASWSVNVNTFK